MFFLGPEIKPVLQTLVTALKVEFLHMLAEVERFWTSLYKNDNEGRKAGLLNATFDPMSQSHVGNQIENLRETTSNI